jgi:hypothetical protein
LSIPDSLLHRALTSNSDLSNTSLATKILVSRLRLDVSSNPGKLAGCIAELQAFVAKHPFAQKDFQAI